MKNTYENCYKINKKQIGGVMERDWTDIEYLLNGNPYEELLKLENMSNRDIELLLP